MFIFNNWFGAVGLYMNDFISLNTFRDDEEFLGYWTVFFFAWFVGYGPMMALFTTRISRRRTIRELVTAVLVSLGEGSINPLQSFIVVTTVLVVLLLLTTFWTVPKVTREMYEEQKHEFK